MKHEHEHEYIKHKRVEYESEEHRAHKRTKRERPGDTWKGSGVSNAVDHGDARSTSTHGGSDRPNQFHRDPAARS